jgi:hypothetical protein
LLRLRVAERLKFTSVAKMVDEIGDEQVDQWCALALVDGWGEDWQRTAWLIERIHNTAMAGKQSDDGRSLILDVWDCRPHFRWERKPVDEPSEAQSDAQLEALGRRMAGF